MVFGFIQDLLTGASPADDDSEIEASDRLQVAVCVLLLETAAEDGTFDKEERRHITEILRQQFSLSETDVSALIERTKQARKEAVDLWRFTHSLNEQLSTEEKMQVIESVWRVVYADGVLNRAEDRLAHKFGNLLRLRHRQVIDAKLAVLHKSDS